MPFLRCAFFSAGGCCAILIGREVFIWGEIFICEGGCCGEHYILLLFMRLLFIISKPLIQFCMNVYYEL